MTASSEKKRQQMREWRLANADRLREYHRKYQKDHYTAIYEEKRDTILRQRAWRRGAAKFRQILTPEGDGSP